MDDHHVPNLKKPSSSHHNPTDYKKVKVLGSGGQGSVSLVKLTASKDVVGGSSSGVVEYRALKRVFCQDLSQLNLALREAQSVLQIGQHMNVVKCYKFFIERMEKSAGNQIERRNIIENESVCIMYEYCELGSLADYVRQKRGTKSVIPFRTALNYLRQILRGVEFIHANRVCHRDMVSILWW